MVSYKEGFPAGHSNSRVRRQRQYKGGGEGLFISCFIFWVSILVVGFNFLIVQTCVYLLLLGVYHLIIFLERTNNILFHVCRYRDNIFVKRSIPPVCFAHTGNNPSTKREVVKEKYFSEITKLIGAQLIFWTKGGYPYCRYMCCKFKDW